MMLSITLPDSLKDFVESEVAAGDYSSPADYILALLREAEKEKVKKRVKALVMEGLNSGEPAVADQAFWDERHESLKKRYPEAYDS